MSHIGAPVHRYGTNNVSTLLALSTFRCANAAIGLRVRTAFEPLLGLEAIGEPSNIAT